jgi:hypothetical protein
MKSAKRYALIVGIVLLIVLVVGIVACAIYGRLLELLYISLVILAILMVGTTLFQIYSIAKLIKAITIVRDEFRPLIGSVQETVGIVKDTAKTAGSTVTTIGSAAKLTSDVALGPGVRTVASVVAARQVVRVFFGKGRARSQAEARRQQQEEAMAAAVAEGGE